MAAVRAPTRRLSRIRRRIRRRVLPTAAS
jgi:hypothetical protein